MDFLDDIYCDYVVSKVKPKKRKTYVGFCNSSQCAGSDRYGGIQVTRDYGQKFCKECGSALFWRALEKHERINLRRHKKK